MVTAEQAPTRLHEHEHEHERTHDAWLIDFRLVILSQGAA